MKLNNVDHKKNSKLDESDICITCNENYYQIENDAEYIQELINNYNFTIQGYYYDKNDNFYKSCYETCKTCDKSGNKKNIIVQSVMKNILLIIQKENFIIVIQNVIFIFILIMKKNLFVYIIILVLKIMIN